MRLKVTEHKAILKLIEEHQLIPERFKIYKKRGLVHIQDLHSKEEFTFYRKKVTRLNEQKQWENEESYFLNLPKKEELGISWDELLKLFEAWLIK